MACGHIQSEFSVSGNGTQSENRSKIFDPFFTTKLGLGEYGVGLSISYNMVKSILRSDVSVANEIGRGPTFIIDLPLSAPTPQALIDRIIIGIKIMVSIPAIGFVHRLRFEIALCGRQIQPGLALLFCQHYSGIQKLLCDAGAA